MEKALEAVYSDPRQPGSYGGVDKVRKGLKKVKNLNASSKEVHKWLTGKDTYTKFRYARKNFKRNPVIAPHIDAQWQADLAEVGNLMDHNDNVKYLLIIIDVVSKYLWVEPLQTKHGPDVLKAFKKVFQNTERKPKKLQTDDGGEFLFGGLQRYLKKLNIVFFTLKSDKKAAIAERVIRTLKQKMYRYMHEKHTKRYIDVLADLVASYNDTYHKSIKMAPAEVTETNEGQVLKNLYGEAWEKDLKKKKPQYAEGQFVRVSSLKGVFEKGYVGNWSEEIFIISSVKLSAVPQIMYKLKDWNGGPIEGSFYAQELQLVSKDLTGFWKVEKVIKTRKVGRKTQYFVKWEGYPDSVNSWVGEKDIKSIDN